MRIREYNSGFASPETCCIDCGQHFAAEREQELRKRGTLMALYFHIVELDNGEWACRHGRHEYDTHDSLEQARTHIRALAEARRPASIFVHQRDGTTRHVEDV